MTRSFNEFKTSQIAVFGDLMLDRYLLGNVSRISPESPVPIVKLARSWSSAGGAGHVAACLAGLGMKVCAIGATGDDPAADEIINALSRCGVNDVHLIRSDRWKTTIKTRIVAGERHQLLRMDEESDTIDWFNDSAPLITIAERIIPKSDAVVLSDYDKGTLTRDVLRGIIDLSRHHGKPVIVDPKKADLRSYSGATAITPNTLEMERALGRQMRDDADVRQTAVRMREEFLFDNLLITRGSHGMTGADADGAFDIPARVREVSDVTGAGDTVVAVLAACLASKTNFRSSCELAGVAAGIAVSHPGTYVVTFDELRAAAGGDNEKVVDLNEAAATAGKFRAAGKKVVFTNGCFDVLHVGHLKLLEEAKKCGDLLVVGVNSDSSVRRIKGLNRPVNAELDRAQLLSGLSCVDLVVLFEEDTPATLIETLIPDVLVKGGDYSLDKIVGASFVTTRGGHVKIVELLPNHSSTRLIQSLQDD